MDGRSLCVAAVQMLSENGQCEANLDRASRLVQKASQAAAKHVGSCLTEAHSRPQ